MTLHTSPERTLELLQQAVDERGADFVYPAEWKDDGTSEGMCMYVQPDENGPACIVGYVLHAYGVALDDLSGAEGMGADNACTIFGVDARSTRMLTLAQISQDNKHTWGHAVQRARDEHVFTTSLEG